MERPMLRPGFPKAAPGGMPMKRRFIDKLKDALTIAAWIVAIIIAVMVYLRHVGFPIGINITAIGLFFLTCAIVFVKSSRYAEDAVVIVGAVVCLMGMFAYVPMSLMWEWVTIVLLGLLISAVNVFRAIRSALQAAEKVGDAVIGAVTLLAQRSTEQAVHTGTTALEVKRARVPRGRAEWAISGLLGVGTLLLALMLRRIAFAFLTPDNIIFMATSLIGIGVLGMLAAAFSISDNANEDLMAGCSVGVAWSGLFLAWPHPAWHIVVLLVVMSLMAGATVGPILKRKIGRLSAP